MTLEPFFLFSWRKYNHISLNIALFMFILSFKTHGFTNHSYEVKTSLPKEILSFKVCKALRSGIFRNTP